MAKNLQDIGYIYVKDPVDKAVQRVPGFNVPRGMQQITAEEAIAQAKAYAPKVREGQNLGTNFPGIGVGENLFDFYQRTQPDFFTSTESGFADKGGVMVDIAREQKQQQLAADPNQVNIGTPEAPLYVPKGSAAHQQTTAPPVAGQAAPPATTPPVDNLKQTVQQQAQKLGNTTLANQNYVNAVFKAYHGRDAKAQELQQFANKGVQDVFNAITAGAQQIGQAPAAAPVGQAPAAPAPVAPAPAPGAPAPAPTAALASQLQNQGIAQANPEAPANAGYINALFQETQGRDATQEELNKFVGQKVKDAANIILGADKSPFISPEQAQIGQQAAQERIAAGQGSEQDFEQTEQQQEQQVSGAAGDTTTPIGSQLSSDPTIQQLIDQAASKGLDFPAEAINALLGQQQQTEEEIRNELYDEYNISEFEEEFRKRPEKTFEDVYQEIYEQTGLGELQVQIKEIIAKFDKAQADFNKAADTINENPWVSESGRVGKMRRLQEASDATMDRLQNQRTLLENLYQRGKDDATNVATRALNAFYKEREFSKEELNFFIQRAELDVEAKLRAQVGEREAQTFRYFPEFIQKFVSPREEGKGFTLSPGQRRFTAGGELVAAAPPKAKAGGGSGSFSSTEKKKLEAAGLLNAPRQQQLNYLFPEKETELSKEEKAFQDVLNEQRDILAQEEERPGGGKDYWGTAWDIIKGRYPDIPNETLDQLLNEG